jgi:hypothetical protein
MARRKSAYQQYQLTQAARAFSRAGFPVHRAKVTSKDVILYFTPDIADDAFEEAEVADNDEWGDFLDAQERKK